MNTTPTTQPKTYQCRHLFTDGHRCGSPSLRHEEFCFYHHTTRRPVAPATNFPHAAQPPAEATFELPFPEDRPTIQLAIGDILRRIAQNRIDPRRAGLLLYGLQIASCNLPKPTPLSTDPRDRDEDHDPEVTDITHHPTLGPLAPQTEYIPYQRPLSFAGQLLREVEEEDARLAEEARNTPTLPTLQAVAHPGTQVRRLHRLTWPYNPNAQSRD